MKKNPRANIRRNNKLAKTLLIWIPILTALILAIAQLLNALPDSAFASPTLTPSRDCQYIVLDTVRTTVTLSGAPQEGTVTLFSGIPVTTDKTFLIDLEDSSSREIGKIKFQYDGNRNRFEIITIVDASCSVVAQVGETSLSDILLESGELRTIVIDQVQIDILLVYLKDEEEIQGSFTLK